MTKRDYNIIARILKQCIADSDEPVDPVLTVEVIARSLGIAFMVDNPRFNIDLFIKTVTGKG